MKKFAYLFVVAILFLGVSCTKERIEPSTNIASDAPVWKSGEVEIIVVDETGTITDPNNDPDENPRRRH